jgi:predicted SAM-dependent methyltransferase
MTTPVVNPNRPTTGDPVRLNVGCGAYALRGFVNIDERPYAGVDVVVSVPPLPYADQTVAEVWACHFLEHLSQADASDFLDECYRVLEPGGMLGLVVPDTREIMRRYLDGERAHVEFPAGQFWDNTDLDDVCAMFLYSTVQPSGHLWSYDLVTLTRLVTEHGFRVLREIDRHQDPRLGTGQWYQCGVQAMKPER